MITLLWNLFMAASWVLMTEQVTPGNFVAGFILGYVILRYVHRDEPDTLYFPRRNAAACVRTGVRAVGFLFYFLWEVLLSSLKVAYYVVMPLNRMSPGVVAIPLDARSDGEILLLANLITLTPGTLSVEVSDDRKALYIHGMDVQDVQALREGIKKGFERQVIELLRSKK